MDKIRIRGGRPLKGQIRISGAKNAALPLMAACLLTDETLTLSNLPHLADITTLANLLVQHGVDLHMNGTTNGGHTGRVLEMTARNITSTRAPYDLVRKMRASVLVLGPLLARFGEAEVSLPGGCAIGTRPVDLHLTALELLGAEIEIREGYIHAKAPNGLHGAEVVFSKVSVGATENLLMAACLAKGTTRLVNSAREPEITDLAECLVKMGAKIEGIGSDTLIVEGVERLHGADHSVVPDRIETGTYAIAAAITNGELELLGARPEHLGAVIEVLTKAGVEFTETEQGMKVRRLNGELHGVDVMTEPFPGLSDRSPGPDHGPDVGGGRRGHDHRIDLRESLHARPRADSYGSERECARCIGHGARSEKADRGGSYGDGSAGFGLSGSRRTCSRGRNHAESGLSPGPRLRAGGRKAGGLWRRHRTDQGLGVTMADDRIKPLKLRAHDTEDMRVIAGILQDALVPLSDVTYLKGEKRFILVANRFRWETDSGSASGTNRACRPAEATAATRLRRSRMPVLPKKRPTSG